MVLHNQVWVTSVVSDDDVHKALVLCYSLKRAHTSRQIAVVVSPAVSRNLKRVLEYGFDYIFTLNQSENLAGLQVVDFAKIYSLLVFQSFGTLVYLSPTMIAVKNCDEIFSVKTDGFNMGTDGCASMFLCKPSVSNYKSIMAFFTSMSAKDIEFGSGMYQWIKQRFKRTQPIHEKYNVTLKVGSPLVAHENNVAIVNLVNYANVREICNLTSMGLLEHRIATYWLEIFQEDVFQLTNDPDFEALEKLVSQYQYNFNMKNEPIAIVGMSCRYPKSNTLEEFWNILSNCENAVSSPPSFRWLQDWHSTAYWEEQCHAGYLSVPIKDFDANFFGISGYEATHMDPQHRILHYLVWEALEDACIDPSKIYGSKSSVFVGSWTNEYRAILEQSSDMVEGFRAYVGNSIGTAAARLSSLLGLKGPSLATESGCSSAAVAVHLAIKSLQCEESDIAFACGVNILVDPTKTTTNLPLFVCKNACCKTFSHDADWFVRAEGAGVLVLKRLSDALKHHDRIWGILRGSAISQCQTKSIGTPTIEGEAAAMIEACSDAKVSPDDVSYLESHGTGTAVGDPVEISAIKEVYGTTTRKVPLIVGSFKTNLGHTESCSGITGITKVVLAMQNNLIPAHRNLTKLHPLINLDDAPIAIPFKSQTWKRQNDMPRLAGVNCFGITGANVHFIVQEPLKQTQKPLAVTSIVDRPLHVLKLSAKSQEAMDLILQHYKDFILNSKDDIADIAFSANTGRANFQFRTVIIAQTKLDVSKAICDRSYFKGEVKSKIENGICFLFSGGGHRAETIQELYMTSPIFRINFDACVNIFRNKYSIDIMDKYKEEISCTPKKCTGIIYDETVTFCMEYALYKLWESWGVKPDYVLGHSLGEFTAAVCAGALTLSDAVKLIVTRCNLINNLSKRRVLEVDANLHTVEEALDEFFRNNEANILEIVAVNSNTQVMVTGDSEVLSTFSAYCKQLQYKVRLLDTTHAWNTSQVEPILEEYKETAKSLFINKNPLKCGFISGTCGDLFETSQKIDAMYWIKHTRERMNFAKGINKAMELDCKLFVDIGPKATLSSLVLIANKKDIYCLPSLNGNQTAWETLFTSLADMYVIGKEVDWEGIDQFHNRRKVRLPHYPFLGKAFWPKINYTKSDLIHPLLGHRIQNASCKKIFECALDIKNHNEYIKDHVVGQTVVMPGACYLETCLAAGLASIHGGNLHNWRPNLPIKVESFKIKAPLALFDSTQCQLQTVVNIKTADESGLSDKFIVEIFHNKAVDSEAEWLLHATAQFYLSSNFEDQRINFDKQQFLNTIAMAGDKTAILKWYKLVFSLGLRYGDAFLRLEEMWRIENGPIIHKVKPPKRIGPFAQYILHPVVIDAMFQAIVLPWLQKTKKICVPIQIGKFVCMPDCCNHAGETYIYVIDGAKNVEHKPSHALLIDANGNILAIMSDFVFVETTVETMESVLDQQISAVPDMFEEILCPQDEPVQHTYCNTTCTGKICSEDFHNYFLDTYNKPIPDTEKFMAQVDTLVYHLILRALYCCGFQPSTNEEISETELIKQLKIQKKFSNIFSFYMDVLEKEMILKRCGHGKWKVVVPPPTVFQVENFLSTNLSKFTPVILGIKVGDKLSEILKGSASVLDILFPGQTSTENTSASVAEFYSWYQTTFSQGRIVCDVVKETLQYGKQPTSGNTVWRILEIGAGTGSITKFLLEELTQNNIDFEYTFTDISSAFFPAAEEKFAKYQKFMKFKTLNIDEDPLCQFFTPMYFDVIFAFEVIHATKNLRNTLNNVKALLKSGGRFDILETTNGPRIIKFIFGLLDGYWNFEDFDIRQNSCTLPIEKWTDILNVSGFEVVKAFPYANDRHTLICSKLQIHDENLQTPLIFSNFQQPKMWLIFNQDDNATSTFLLKKIHSLPNRIVVRIQQGDNFEYHKGIPSTISININSETDFIELVKHVNEADAILEGILYCWTLQTQKFNIVDAILKPFFYLVKSISKLSKFTGCKFIVLAKELSQVDTKYDFNVGASTILGVLKSFQNERHDIFCRFIDIAYEEAESDIMNTFYELWNTESGSVLVSLSNNQRFVPKVSRVIPKLPPLLLPPGTKTIQLALSDSDLVADLHFVPLQTPALSPNYVYVQVKAFSLNFRDLLVVLNYNKVFESERTFGYDFSGVVVGVHPEVTKWRVGDEIYTEHQHNLRLPSHIQIHEDDIYSIPKDMTFGEACTIPLVSSTTYYSLIEIAKLTSADTVLIHAASGGVGLSAIALSQQIGANVVATVGSKQKENYLRQIGVQHIFNSRNTDYAQQILKLTNGRGVDVVLNSLTGKGFKEATLNVCAEGARFVELSLVDIWSSAEVFAMRPDIVYTDVELAAWNTQTWRRYMTKVHALVLKNHIVSIPYVRFSAMNIRNALNYFKSAKHIGKIVIFMPEIIKTHLSNNYLVPYFNSKSTYIITGGLGGIGFEVCKWMISKGAKFVLLIGRTSPSKTRRDEIYNLKSKHNAVIDTIKMDVSEYNQLKELIYSDIVKWGYPPLRGVMHAAGSLHDGLIENQTWCNFVSTFKAKVDGTFNLHELTKTNPRMEYFVLFSSVAAVYGPPGQSNHSAGNCFEDAVAVYRNSVGLPATSVNWGIWGEVGIATEINIHGLKPLSTLQGITGLEYVLDFHRTRTIITSSKNLSILIKMFSNVFSLQNENSKVAGSKQVNMKISEFLQKYNATENIEEKAKIAKDQIRVLVKNICRLDDSDNVSDTIDLAEIGMDSYMFVEVRNGIKRIFENKDIDVLRDCKSVQDLTDKLVYLLEDSCTDHMK